MSHIKSFGDLGDDRSDHSGDEGDGFNDYYAGGEKSGQLIRGAPKHDSDDDEKDKVASLFNKARKAGAVQGTAEDLGEGSGAFKGTGRTLAGGSSGAGSSQAAQGPVKYVITFYRNNIFTVNDGPPRNVMDPANHSFITSISRGECPEELEPPVRGTPIDVNLVRKEEEYKEPEKPKYTAFAGSGRTLGSSSAAGGSSGAGSGGSGAAAAAAAAAKAAENEWEGVDESKPTTSLQLRLADGSRMVAKFNHSHRVLDIRRFIRASRPDITFPYTLATGVPPQPVTDEDRTLEEAGLLNAVIIQRK